MTDHIDVPIVATGDWIDAAWINQYIGDNVRAWRQAYTAAGMMAYAVDLNTLAGLALVPGGIMYAGASTPLWLAKPGSLGVLKNDATGVPGYVTGGTAWQVLQKNTANNGLEFADPRLKTTIVSRSANGSVTGAIPWDVEPRDDGGWHDNVTNPSRITVTATGLYRPAATIGLWMPSGGAIVNHEIELRVNGTAVRMSRKAFKQEGTLVTLEDSGVPLQLNANDYVEVATLNAKTVAGDVGGQHSFFALTKIG